MKRTFRMVLMNVLFVNDIYSSQICSSLARLKYKEVRQKNSSQLVCNCFDDMVLSIQAILFALSAYHEPNGRWIKNYQSQTIICK